LRLQVNENLFIVLLNLQIPSPIQELYESLFEEKEIRLFIKRDDLIHPVVSGNKWRKLKYSILKAKELGHSTLISFGGAYSNHIHALASAANNEGLKSIGIIRGEEVKEKLNQTLLDAQNNGMQLHFISREEYKKKEDPEFIDSLIKKFGAFYLVPEGGKSKEGVKGCSEIIQEIDVDYDYIALACGTGTTMAGIISELPQSKQALGFPILKGGDFLKNDIEELLTPFKKDRLTNWELKANYHFGGYAKTTPELLSFIDSFETKFNIPLDQVYTGKLVYGIFDLIKNDYFPSKSIVLILHTGGIQGKIGLKR
jgi:1-aminocyclopropane-1-carboxylate deaminase/D-cysteine desulfhydrase-like pyridoxal-dependent ACC family enzyme